MKVECYSCGKELPLRQYAMQDCPNCKGYAKAFRKLMQTERKWRDEQAKKMLKFIRHSNPAEDIITDPSCVFTIISPQNLQRGRELHTKYEDLIREGVIHMPFISIDWGGLQPNEEDH